MPEPSLPSHPYSSLLGSPERAPAVSERDLLASVLEHTREGVVACDARGVLTYFNRATRELHGLPVEALPAEEWAEHYALYRADGTTRMSMEEVPLFRALRDGKIRDMEMVIAPVGRERRRVLVNGEAIRDDQGRVAGAIVTMSDITASSRAAEELKALNRELEARVEARNAELLQSEARFRTVFEQSPLSFQILSPDGRTKFVNPAWEKLWCFSREFIESFILKSYNVLEDPLLEAQGITPLIRRAIAGEACELPLIQYDPKANGFPGEARWISAVIYPLKDESGRVVELVLIHLDVTDRKRAEQTLNLLASTTATLQGALESSRVLDAFAAAVVPEACDGLIIDLLEDGALRRLLTRHREPGKQALLEELQRRYPPSLDSPQPNPRVIRSGLPERVDRLDPAAIREHTYDDAHAELISRIGFRSFLAIPMRVRGEVIGALNFINTSERRAFDERDTLAFEELGRRAAVAIDSARLHEDTRRALRQRDEFISIASHELKTPITSLKLQAQLAARKLKSSSDGGLEPAAARSLVDTSLRQLERLTRLVEDMLDVSRVATGKLTLQKVRTDLKELVGEVVGRFKPQLEAIGVPIELVAPAPAFAHCDPMRIDQVVTNLITNAIRYGESSPIQVAVESTQGQVRIRVKDRGMGIQKSDQERIFRRFERAISANISGLGLGLYISQEIVREHGGAIRVKSEPGQGAEFTVELPEA